MRRLTAILLAVLICPWACAAAAGTYRQISQEEAKEMMARDDGHIIVDVRRPDEFDAGHIPGAVLIPNETILDERPAQLPDPDQVILIYCRSGRRSKEAAQKLADMGYTRIYEFGGIIDWTGETVTEEPAGTENTEGNRPAVIGFNSFDGGGHEYTAAVEDPSVAACRAERDYGNIGDEVLDGASYTARFTITGLKEGTTEVTVWGRSPIMENDTHVYRVTVDSSLNVDLVPVRKVSTFFMYRNGEIAYDSYRVTLEEDGYHISVNDGEDRITGNGTADALLQVIERYSLADWDGFSESRTGVLDGEGFWLEFRLTDGTSVLARGENAFPEHYFDAISELQDILDSAEILPLP